jgi:hypothetical protein
MGQDHPGKGWNQQAKVKRINTCFIALVLIRLKIKIFLFSHEENYCQKEIEMLFRRMINAEIDIERGFLRKVFAGQAN